MGIVTRASGMMKVLKAVKKEGLKIECIKYKHSFAAKKLIAKESGFSYEGALQYYKAICKIMERLSDVKGREWKRMKLGELLANSGAMEIVVFGKEDIDWKWH